MFRLNRLKRPIQQCLKRPIHQFLKKPIQINNLKKYSTQPKNNCDNDVLINASIFFFVPFASCLIYCGTSIYIDDKISESINTKNTKNIINTMIYYRRDDYTETLYKIIHYDFCELDTVKAFETLGADLKYSFIDGDFFSSYNSILQEAINFKKYDIINYLLEKTVILPQCKITIRYDNIDDIEVFKIFVKNKIEIQENWINNAIHYNNWEVLEYLLENGGKQIIEKKKKKKRKRILRKTRIRK